MSPPGKTRSISWSVIVGTLLVPVSAVAAVAVAVSAGGSEPVSRDDTATAQVVPEPTGLQSAATPAKDLESACGPAGQDLVALEQNGDTTDVQQAALDALRDICDQEGRPLPARSAPPGSVTAQQGSTGSVPAGYDDRGAHDRDDDEWDDDDRHDDDRRADDREDDHDDDRDDD